jgi:hypothetical protein
MYGGATAGAVGDRVNLCQEYDPVANTWVSRAPMANRRNWIKGFWTKNNRLYAIGGINEAGTFLTVNEEYDPVANTWITRAPLPAARAAYLGGVWRDSLIYVMGGIATGGVGQTTVYIYNPFTNTWVTGTPLPRAGDMGDAVIVGDTIFIAQAYDRPAAVGWPNLVKGYIDPAVPTSITWITGPAHIAVSPVGGATALGRDVYWLGGFINLTTVTNRWWKYDGTTGTISEMTPLYPVTLARNCYMTARPSENALYVVAGDSGGDWAVPNQTYMKYIVSTGIKETEEKMVSERELLKVTNPLKTPVVFSNITRLYIYDVTGKTVNVINQQNGNLIWDGKDRNGKAITNGVYFLKAQSDNRSIVKKVVIMQ